MRRRNSRKYSEYIAIDLRDEAARMTVDEIAGLLARQSALELQVDVFNSQVREMNDLIAQLKGTIQEQEQRLDWFKRQVFGSRTERRILEASPGCEQLLLGQEILDIPEAPPTKGTTVAGYERKHRKNPVEFAHEHSKLRFTADVPIQVIDVPNPALDGLAPDLLQEVTTESTFRLAQRSPYIVLEYRRKVIKRNDTGELLRAPVPPCVIPKIPTDVSFLARMLVDKYMHRLPLYRQHQRLEQSGVHIGRLTLTRLVHRVGQLLEPIYAALLSSVMTSGVLAVDESYTPAGLKPRDPDTGKPGKIKRAYFWAFYGELKEIAFVFSPFRGLHVLEDALQQFQGQVLLTDGYIVYESYTLKMRLVLACCWSHARRYFVRAERVEPSKVAFVLGCIRALFQVEEGLQEVDLAARLQARQELSRPIVNALFAFLHEELNTAALLPSNAFLTAVEYAVNRENELRVFLDDPRVALSTNHLERAFRPAAVGRKNWMFHMTEAGARYGAIFYSLIQSCVLADVDPCTYLTDVLQRIDIHPGDRPDLLTPRLWKEHFAKDPLISDVSRGP